MSIKEAFIKLASVYADKHFYDRGFNHAKNGHGKDLYFSCENAERIYNNGYEDGLRQRQIDALGGFNHNK